MHTPQTLPRLFAYSLLHEKIHRSYPQVQTLQDDRNGAARQNSLGKYKSNLKYTVPKYT